MMPISESPLTNLREETLDHWQEFFPKMVAKLQEEGKLDAALDEAVERTTTAVLNYVATYDGDKRAGLLSAWEIYREEWCFLRPSSSEEETIEGEDQELIKIRKDLFDILSGAHDDDEQDELEEDDEF
ncbi:MAG: hypothetical protein AB9888_15240 [Bacteroidales bacterium]